MADTEAPAAEAAASTEAAPAAASTDKLDMALDDVVKAMRKSKRGGFRGRGRGRGGRGRGGRGRGGRGRGRGGKGNQGGRQGGKQQVQISGGTSKLTISNLNFGVSDSDIQELFSEFGKIKSAAVHFNSVGKSLGTAHVIYNKLNSAKNALTKYNGVQLDGRPMRITMEGATITGGNKQSAVKRLGQGPRGGRRGRGGRGRGRGGRGGRGGKGGKPKPKTAEELDAELDAYLNTKPQTAEDLDADLDAYSKSKGEAAAEPEAAMETEAEK